MLDTNHLDIRGVTAEDGTAIAFELGHSHPAFGSPLRVPLTEAQILQTEFKVCV